MGYKYMLHHFNHKSFQTPENLMGGLWKNQNPENPAHSRSLGSALSTAFFAKNVPFFLAKRRQEQSDLMKV